MHSIYNVLKFHAAVLPKVSKRTVFTNVHSDYVKNSILKASLPFVLEHGWSVAAIEEGARTISCPRDIYKGLLGKGDDLALYFYKQSNEKLRKLMKTGQVSGRDPELFVCNAVETRLRMIIPLITRWREALDIMEERRNVYFALANLLTLVDNICYYAGDNVKEKSGYFLRRIGLATIYRITEERLIQDNSFDYQSTWKFLSEQLKETVELEPAMREVIQSSVQGHGGLDEAFDTAREIVRKKL